MRFTIYRTALAAALVMSSAGALAAHLEQVPACTVSHNENEKVCQLSLRDGDFGRLDAWRIHAGDPERRTDNGMSYIRLAQPGVGVSQVVGLPLGSTVDTNRMPTYWIDLRLRTVHLSADDVVASRGPATARVRVSLTDEHGENGLVLDEKTVEAGMEGWSEVNLSVNAESYHFNAFLKIEIIRDDGEPLTVLDLDDVAITQLTI